MSFDEQAKAELDQKAARAEQAKGDLTDDKSEKAEGMLDEAKGKLHEMVDKAKDAIHDATDRDK
jgi:uncharacterized protein YjbJ (UPF0337 family)